MPFTPIWTPKEAAVYLRTTTGALAQLRYTGGGPRFVKAGPKRVLYRQHDIDEWLDAQTRTITGEGISA